MRAQTYQPWRRKDTNPDSDPEKILLELQRRELTDLERCRQVWEREFDPLALCVAVTKSNLPEWLTNALLVQLTDGQGSYPSYRERLWRDRRQHAIDGRRAAFVAGVRAHPDHPTTWDDAYEIGEELARLSTDMSTVTPAGAKKSFQRVCRGLQRPGRYYRAPLNFTSRIRNAWAHFLSLMTIDIESQKVGTKDTTQST
jgi:hypothetical protein